MAFFEFPHTRTYDSDLGWLIKNVKGYNDAIEALNAWKEETEKDINDLKEIIDMLRQGILPDDIANAIKAWIAENFYDIVGQMTMTVWFGLTDSGYFVAYVPDSWKEVVFKTTGYDYETELQPDYGHLVLQANYYTHSI